ncbi:hypothetical protein [Herpetosiphon giganteus]|uniref:hypothetical protein n=1 Tax=Herpetosiphon giganteus TaxID=2029754 RepID=UPI00195868F3|nr:hypothetical protein [Herpetosiphon giganteus]MBM7843574.1 hypothetical protein [Herpetosiphon giganteus]
MTTLNAFKKSTLSLLLARMLNAASFGLALMLAYPSSQINQLYGVLGLLAAIGMLWLTTRLTKNPADYQTHWVYLHAAIVLGLLVLGFSLGFSSLQLFGATLIWLVVGLLDGAFRLRKQR